LTGTDEEDLPPLNDEEHIAAARLALTAPASQSDTLEPSWAAPVI
jgi:hypothetical protein